MMLNFLDIFFKELIRLKIHFTFDLDLSTIIQLIYSLLFNLFINKVVDVQLNYLSLFKE